MTTLNRTIWNSALVILIILMPSRLLGQNDPLLPFIFSCEANGLRAGLYLQSSEKMLMRFDAIASTNQCNTALIYKRYLCGPITMADGHGRVIPPKRPEVNKPETYPLYVEWDLRKAGKPWVRDWPVKLGTDKPALIGVHLLDYFKIETPGEYQLTWTPILYVATICTNEVMRYQRVTFSTIKVNTVITHDVLGR